MPPHLGIILWSVLGVVACGHAASVTLSWQNPAGPLDGIRVYQGTESGVYTQVTDVGVVQQVSIGELTVGQSYVFAVTAFNGAGESGYSNEVSTVIQEPPTVVITNPMDGAMVLRKSEVNLEAHASDDAGVARIEFYVNEQWHCGIDAPAYQCPWDVPAPPQHQYTLVATATDVTGKIGTSAPVRVTSC